jgi:hypothetical protein
MKGKFLRMPSLFDYTFSRLSPMQRWGLISVTFLTSLAVGCLVGFTVNMSVMTPVVIPAMTMLTGYDVFYGILYWFVRNQK